MNWAEGTGTTIRVTAPDMTALIDDLGGRMARGEGFTVATLNLDHVVKLRHDPAFRAAYAAHSHVTADGNPIVWLSRLAGRRVALVPGSELIQPVLERAAKHGVPVAFFGSDDDTLRRAAATLSVRIPGLRIVRTSAPAMGFDPDGAEAAAAIEALRAAGAGLCLVALGAPRQERFAARAAADLPGTGFLSIGAGLDFIAGRQRRAPRWVQALAAEWIWRMLGDPARLARRYGACLAILPRLTIEALRTR